MDAPSTLERLRREPAEPGVYGRFCAERSLFMHIQWPQELPFDEWLGGGQRPTQSVESSFAEAIVRDLDEYPA